MVRAAIARATGLCTGAGVGIAFTASMEQAGCLGMRILWGGMMNNDHFEVEFELWQHGMPVARAMGNRRESTWVEIQHYVEIYSKTGPVEIYELARRRIKGEKK